MESEAILERMQYELMLFSRYYMRPHHNDDAVLDRSANVLLSRLEHVEPMTLKEISLALRLDSSTIHRQVAALLRRGFLDYVPVAADEVARRVSPTRAGLAALVATRKAFEAGIRSVVGGWPEGKRVQFLELMRDFNQEVEALEGTSWPRGQ